MTLQIFHQMQMFFDDLKIRLNEIKMDEHYTDHQNKTNVSNKDNRYLLVNNCQQI